MKPLPNVTDGPNFRLQRIANDQHRKLLFESEYLAQQRADQIAAAGYLTKVVHTEDDMFRVVVTFPEPGGKA